MNRQVRRPVCGAHLCEPEGGEGGRAVIMEHEAEDAEQLSVEAAVAQSEQEAAEHGYAHANTRHTCSSSSSSRSEDAATLEVGGEVWRRSFCTWV